MSFSPPILLVDNERRSIDVLKIILESEGFRVDTAYGGQVAIEKMKDVKYGAIIVDFALPDMKGNELADKIRLQDPEIGIILLTGFKSSLPPARLKGFEFVLEKPVSPKRIIEAVKQVIRVSD